MIKQTSGKTCCLILTLSGGTNSPNNITDLSQHQEAIQFRNAEKMIDQDYELGLSHRSPDAWGWLSYHAFLNTRILPAKQLTTNSKICGQNLPNIRCSQLTES